MINIDYTSRTPIYEQIVNEVERFVTLGIYMPKQKIESVRELASSLGINPNTVKKAYDELERRNVINTISTKGTFIAEDIKSVTNLKVEEKISIIKNELCELEKLRDFEGRYFQTFRIKEKCFGQEKNYILCKEFYTLCWLNCFDILDNI